MPATTTAQVKVLSSNAEGFTVGGYGVVWGGQDIVGDFFSKTTNFFFDELSHNPIVLYQHGRDPQIKRSILGKVTRKRADELGLWIEAQIDASKQYAAAIRQLVEQGVLGWSSGAVPHLVERKAGPGGTKEITAWPVAEWSLTPTPAEPRTLGIRELKALAQLEPSLLKATSLVDESYEDLISDLTDAASAALGGMCCVVATYASHVIVCQMTPGDSDGEYFDFPYTLDDSGEPVLGDPSPVQQAYVPDTDTEGKAVEETKPYNIRRQGGTYAVVGPNGRVAGRHKTRAEAIAQMRALYANVPDARKEATSMPDDTKAQQGLARSDYAWVDADGTGHLDISDEGHVRAAMARFNQTHFDSPAAKR